MSSIEFTADIGEALNMLTAITGALNPEGRFAREIPRKLDERMHIQQQEMFDTQGNGEWPQLSDFRVRVRESSGPILDDSGTFKMAASEYVGMWSVSPETFTYIYPGMMQDLGQYFGITAGQRVNPLARYTKRTGNPGVKPTPKPMKQVPRPILFGEARMRTDLESVLREFLGSSGFIGVGITGYAGE